MPRVAAHPIVKGHSSTLLFLIRPGHPIIASFFATANVVNRSNGFLWESLLKKTLEPLEWTVILLPLTFDFWGKGGGG